ncbi:leucine rich adaptor protein 1 [Bombina bombina]|uniref:leucine rich adaptor protein 1 n=1 Tax=Bombina bombina TaxID=8345 RepID=UPI00235A8468|nr:leucine rich adaptor protein 1 [Bombina bombina]
MAQTAAGRQEGGSIDASPDLKDIETKVGRKTPDGLLRWMREDPVLLLEEKGQVLLDTSDQGLGDKIKALKLELACLRAIDVKILQQLVAVNEGIEAVKWILEEKGNLTSRCSSLTSSQYSLAESQETSRRGSWNSLQDPADKLDSISIGSYLDTLADDMDEYSLSISEPIVSSTPNRQGLTLAPVDHDVTKLEQQREGPLGPASYYPRGENDKAKKDREYYMSTLGQNSFDNTRISKQMTPSQASYISQTPNRSLGKHAPALELCAELNTSTDEKQSKIKLSRNGKLDLDKCKLNSKLHLEYDAHWQWVQSQDDVTFL